MSLLEELKKIRDEGPRNRELGICANVRVEYDEELKVMFYDWPEFSGNIIFPVRRPEFPPRDAFMLDQDMWGDSPYGQARWALLHWLIERLEEQEYEHA